MFEWQFNNAIKDRQSKKWVFIVKVIQVNSFTSSLFLN